MIVIFPRYVRVSASGPRFDGRFVFWQDFRKDMAKTASILTVAPIVVNYKDYEDDVKGYHAKAMQVCASYGISRHDLPQQLTKRLINLLATGDPDVSAEDVKQAKKRKNEGEENKRAAKAKKSEAASGKKRKVKD